MDYMFSNYLFDVFEYYFKFVCILFKNFKKKSIVFGFEVIGEEIIGLRFFYVLLLCKSLSICICERKSF